MGAQKGFEFVARHLAGSDFQESLDDLLVRNGERQATVFEKKLAGNGSDTLVAINKSVSLAKMKTIGCRAGDYIGLFVLETIFRRVQR